MKTILLLLLSYLPLWAATTYTVISDNTNRTITGGTTNLSLLNATNQVFTGTNTFPAASFYPANNIGLRLLWSSPTNIYLPTLVVNATSSLTNNGDYVNTTALGKITLPPLVGTNSMVFIVESVERTNANTTAGVAYIYLGANTNYIGGGQLVATSLGKTGVGLSQGVFANSGSFTNQVQLGGYASPLIWGTSNFVDTSTAWDMYIGFSTATSHTNVLFPRFAIYELPQ